MPETIDHSTLAQLVAAGTVRGAHIVGQPGGWAVMVKCGGVERPLAAQRTRAVRLFRRFDTLVNYLKELGLSRYDVDAAEYDPATPKSAKRPDRAVALKKAHEAAAYDQWFREQVDQAIKEADDPATQWVSHEDVAADWRKQRVALAKRLKAKVKAAE